MSEKSMKIDKLHYENDQWINVSSEIEDKSSASIVFVFGDTDVLKNAQSFNTIQAMFP